MAGPVKEAQVASTSPVRFPEMRKRYPSEIRRARAKEPTVGQCSDPASSHARELHGSEATNAYRSLAAAAAYQYRYIPITLGPARHARWRFLDVIDILIRREPAALRRANRRNYCPRTSNCLPLEEKTLPLIHQRKHPA